MNKKGLWGFLLFLSIIVPIALAMVGIDSKIIGQTPCVDGRNRINLEGIMCENVEATFFGHSIFYIFLLIIPFNILIVLFFVLYTGYENIKGVVVVISLVSLSFIWLLIMIRI